MSDDTSPQARPSGLLPTPARRDEPTRGGALREFLRRLMRGENLRRAEAAQLLDALLDEEATDAQIGATLVALATKGETVEELAGLASAMRARAVRVGAAHSCFIDTAGTGSSRAKTFNVSTAAAFVIAGAGLPVAKHGSRAATSRSGSADVLAALGVNVSSTPGVSESCLNGIGICFMFAPLYHGATARVAAVRRELGVHTTFNLLGPLTNPAGAPRQLIGVWHETLVEPVALTLNALGTERAWVVHGQDGLDEVTLDGATKVGEVVGGSVRVFAVRPEDFGLSEAALDGLRGGDAEQNARIIREILSGQRRGAGRDLVVVNAAAALHVGGLAEDLKAAARLAEQSIDTGAALDKLDKLVKASNE
ncbi:MAG TPA: anthranilate phosphoribosyltransferase [Pyrinomonadaceae bacterium]|jgi:anthranilate phosphoribosyltransferase|nr:anthranilate phosphoribosyltransferase [Pyrinomonadaceae bacterium]